MTDKTEYVLNGFIELSNSEKKEFIAELDSYVKESPRQKEEVRKSIRESVVLGPTTSGGCPCCGK